MKIIVLIFINLFYYVSLAHAGTVAVFFSSKIDIAINESTVKDILTSKFVQKNLRIGIVIPDDDNQNVESFTDYNWRELNKLWRIRFFTGRALMPILIKDQSTALSMIKADNKTIIVVFDDIKKPSHSADFIFLSLKN